VDGYAAQRGQFESCCGSMKRPRWKQYVSRLLSHTMGSCTSPSVPIQSSTAPCGFGSNSWPPNKNCLDSATVFLQSFSPRRHRQLRMCRCLSGVMFAPSPRRSHGRYLLYPPQRRLGRRRRRVEAAWELFRCIIVLSSTSCIRRARREILLDGTHFVRLSRVPR